MPAGADRLGAPVVILEDPNPFLLNRHRALALIGRRKLLIEVGGYKVDPIEVEPREPLAEREVADFSRERLANYKVPQVVELRDEIPRSPLGKVRRKYLV